MAAYEAPSFYLKSRFLRGVCLFIVGNDVSGFANSCNGGMALALAKGVSMEKAPLGELLVVSAIAFYV